tara:strand:+ start:6108 stop:6431 length:324 start_codon:yes stop_codon:yes gene_type:complete
MFGSKDENKKYVAKLHPLFNKANSAKDVVSGKTFQTNSGTELESSEWNRLKDKTWTLDGKSYPLLIVDEEIAEEEDNEPSDDYVDDTDIEDFASNGSVLQDTEVEEE